MRPQVMFGSLIILALTGCSLLWTEAESFVEQEAEKEIESVVMKEGQKIVGKDF